jgi:hypothetical protein
MAEPTWELIEKVKGDLGFRHRIKHGCDYAIALKYGKVHLLAHIAYADSIIECLKEHGIEPYTVHLIR